MDTREYILTNITQLFNRQGFISTSLRQAAAYLDMSDGNLRYHFKNKEVLVMDLFEQMMTEMEQPHQTEEADLPLLLEEVRKQFRSTFFTMYRYKFIFLESSLLLKQYPSFKKAYRKFIKMRKAFIHSFIQAYGAKGYFRPQPGQHASEMLFEQLLILSDNWIKYAELDESGSASSMDRKIEHYIELCMHLLITALTEEGNARLSRQIPKVGKAGNRGLL